MIDMNEPIEARPCGCKYLPRLNEYADRCAVHAANPLAPVCDSCEKTGAITPTFCNLNLCPECFAWHHENICDTCDELQNDLDEELSDPPDLPGDETEAA